MDFLEELEGVAGSFLRSDVGIDPDPDVPMLSCSYESAIELEQCENGEVIDVSKCRCDSLDKFLFFENEDFALVVGDGDAVVGQPEVIRKVLIHVEFLETIDHHDEGGVLHPQDFKGVHC